MEAKGKTLDKAKQKHKKGLWSPDEDQKLRDYIINYGHGCWSSVPVNAGLQRNGKSCRLRWINYLRPGLKRGIFTVEEEESVIALHAMLGNKWSQMAQHLPGRTDNEIKNYWHSYLKKRVASSEAQTKPGNSGSTENNTEESLPSPAKSTTQNSSSESIKQSEVSSNDTEQFVSQMDFPGEAGNKGSLRKVLFAEWLDLDQFRDQNNISESTTTTSANPIVDNKNNFDYYYNSDFQDAFMNDLIFQEGNIGSDINHQEGPSDGAAVGNMFQTAPKFEDHFSENGFVDFISGPFNLTCDDMYL